MAIPVNHVVYHVELTVGDIHTAAKFVTAITADSKNEYLYVANEFTKKIYSFKIKNSSNNCVDVNQRQLFLKTLAGYLTV